MDSTALSISSEKAESEQHLKLGGETSNECF